MQNRSHASNAGHPHRISQPHRIQAIYNDVKGKSLTLFMVSGLVIFLTNRHNCGNGHWVKDIRRTWNTESSLLRDQKNLGEQWRWRKDLWDSGFSSPEDSLRWNGWKAWGRHLNRTNGKRGGSRDNVKHPRQHSVFAFLALGFFPPQRQLFLAPFISVWSSVFYSLLMLNNALMLSNPVTTHSCIQAQQIISVGSGDT